MIRDQVIKYLASDKIQARPIWGLISDQKSYRGNQIYKIEKTRQYLENVVDIPCSSNLTKADVGYVID